MDPDHASSVCVCVCVCVGVGVCVCVFVHPERVMREQDKADGSPICRGYLTLPEIET